MENETIAQYGEFELIAKLQEMNQCDLGPGEYGMGDDCSVIPLSDDLYQVATTDLLVEGVHFLKSKIRPAHLGQKAVEASLSDIASMGAIPKYAFLSIAIPQTAKIGYLDDFFKGVLASCKRAGVKLMGGDTTKSLDKLVINVLIQGEVERNRLKMRSGAQPGDIIACTGVLGDSQLGLDIILENLKSADDEYFIERHNRPRAHDQEGRWLSQFSEVNAMMDISDGVASDIGHICKQSNLGCEIEIEKIPISMPAEKIQDKLIVQELALCSGEEYCILATISPVAANDIRDKFKTKFGKDLFFIGVMSETKDQVFLKQGNPIKNSLSGFDHFGGKNE